MHMQVDEFILVFLYTFLLHVEDIVASKTNLLLELHKILLCCIIWIGSWKERNIEMNKSYVYLAIGMLMIILMLLEKNGVIQLSRWQKNIVCILLVATLVPLIISGNPDFLYDKP